MWWCDYARSILSALKPARRRFLGWLNSQITVTTQNINKNILNFSTDGLVRNNGALLNEAEITLQADDLSKNAKRILSLSAVGQIAIKKDDKNSTETNKWGALPLPINLTVSVASA